MNAKLLTSGTRRRHLQHLLAIAIIPLVLFCISANQLYAQGGMTTEKVEIVDFEQTLIQDFPEVIKNIREKISPVLSRSNRSLLSKVKFQLDTSYLGLQLNSNSNTRTITYNLGVFKAFGRDLIAYTISREHQSTGDFLLDIYESEFYRPNFYSFYSTYLTRISDTINVVEAAELSDEQINFVNMLQASPDFAWAYKIRLVFTFLHEFYHQIQDYSKLSSDIMKRNLSPEERATRLMKLEEEADFFAMNIAPKIRIVPISFVAPLHLLGTFKENKIYTEAELNVRKQKYLAKLAIECPAKYAQLNVNCDALEKEVRLAAEDMKQAFEQYTHELVSHSRVVHKQGNFQLDDLNDLFNAGKVYMCRNTYIQKNLDSSLFYFENACKVVDATRNFELLDRQQQLTYEMSALLAGKILELYKNDKNCITYFEKAKRSQRYMPADYYSNLLKRMLSKFS